MAGEAPSTIALKGVAAAISRIAQRQQAKRLHFHRLIQQHAHDAGRRGLTLQPSTLREIERSIERLERQQQDFESSARGPPR